MSGRLRILAPVRSLQMLELQLEAGADEVYLAMADPDLQVLTHHSRFATAGGHPTQVEDPGELAALVERAHAAGCPVGFMANGYYVAADLAPGFLRHVQAAVAAGVDYVAVGHPAAALLLREAGVAIPLAVGTLAGTVNAAQVRWLRELGVTRVMLPPALLLPEVAALARVEGMQVVVYATTGQGNLCAHCRLWECPRAERAVGPGCRAHYRVTLPDGTVRERVPALDGAVDCSLCSLAALQEAGVYGVKVIGRESPSPAVNAKIVELFRRGAEHAAAGGAMGRLKEDLDREELVFAMLWAPRFCEPQRCAFLDTPATRAYV